MVVIGIGIRCDFCCCVECCGRSGIISIIISIVIVVIVVIVDNNSYRYSDYGCQFFRMIKCKSCLGRSRITTFTIATSTTITGPSALTVTTLIYHVVLKSYNIHVVFVLVHYYYFHEYLLFLF